ncbi:MAG: biotin/lipoyl-binding protein [Proteobacteria bacterium]|nr:biotin/lipoyl-binding protein [Pseudomonadota bacterium]
MSYKDLRELVELINSCSHFGEFHLKLGELELDLRRGDPGAAPAAAALVAPAAAALRTAAQAVAPAPASQESPARQRQGHVGGGELIVDASQGQASAPSAHSPALAFPPGSVLVKSPMVGSCYRAPEPGARPFVEVGQTVQADSTVCIIEVMKLMNSIPAPVAGTVTHILVGDGEAVEYGQVLMVVDPA